MRWVALLVFGGIGLSALVGGAMWGVGRYPLFRDGLRAQGMVVAQREATDSYYSESKNRSYQSATTYYPVVEFQTETEEKIRFEGSTGGEGKPIIETGTPVDVIYDPNNPSDAQVSDFTQFWLGPVIVAGGGFIFLLMGIGGFLLIRRQDRQLALLAVKMRREALSMDGSAIAIRGIIARTERLKGRKERYLFICRARRPGESFDEELESDFFDFDPGITFEGRSVEIFLDPNDSAIYYVNFDPLLPEIVRMKGR